MILVIFWKSLSYGLKTSNSAPAITSLDGLTRRATTVRRSSMQVSMARSFSSMMGYVGCFPAGNMASSLLRKGHGQHSREGGGPYSHLLEFCTSIGEPRCSLQTLPRDPLIPLFCDTSQLQQLASECAVVWELREPLGRRRGAWLPRGDGGGGGGRRTSEGREAAAHLKLCAEKG